MSFGRRVERSVEKVSSFRKGASPFCRVGRYGSVVEDELQQQRKPRVSQFEDLKVWREARQSAEKIYCVTDEIAFRRDDFPIRQLRATAVSVSANIAEGFERDGNREFPSFLSPAKGSTGEVRSLLWTASDQSYINEEQFSRLTSTCRRLDDLSRGSWITFATPASPATNSDVPTTKDLPSPETCYRLS